MSAEFLDFFKMLNKTFRDHFEAFLAALWRDFSIHSLSVSDRIKLIVPACQTLNRDSSENAVNLYKENPKKGTNGQEFSELFHHVFKMVSSISVLKHSLDFYQRNLKVTFSCFSVLHPIKLTFFFNKLPFVY